jgi:hypothetical protein
VGSNAVGWIVGEGECSMAKTASTFDSAVC